MLQKYHYNFQTCLTYFDLIDTIFTISLWEEFFMKGLKAILGITLAATTIGGAAAFAATRNLNSLQKATATAPTNTRRIWIINNDNWWTDNDYYVYAWNSNGSTNSSAVTMVLGGYYHGLGFVDITLAGATTELSVIVRDGYTDWGNNNQTVTINLGILGDGNDNEGDTIWLNSGVTWNYQDNRNDRNASTGITTGFAADELATIFTKGEYIPCNASNQFGYNSYYQMNKNFYGPTDADLTEEIVEAPYTVQNYIDTMAAMYAKYN